MKPADSNSPRGDKNNGFFSQLSPAYRAALALNNMAISLLERGDYQDATKALGDSLTLLKLSFHPAASHHDEQQGAVDNWKRLNHQTKVSQEKLHATEQRLAESFRFGRNLSHHQGQIHPLEEEDFAIMRSAIMIGSSHGQFYPVRVRDSQFSTSTCYAEDSSCWSQSQMDAERQFGIVLYNHGLAHLLRFLREEQSSPYRHSLAVNKTLSPDRLHNRSLTLAYRSLTLSHLSHSRCWGHEEQQGQGNNVSEVFPSILLSALALNSLCEVLKIQHHFPKASEALEAALGLCSMVDEDFFASYYASKNCPEIAAAA